MKVLSKLEAKEDEQTIQLASYLPNGSNGLIIITTRNTQMGKILAGPRETISIRPMTAEDAETLLQSRIPKSGRCKADARRLLSDLEYLPLAITQAATYIGERNMTIAQYLQLLTIRMGLLLSKERIDLRRDIQARNSVVQTWRLSFDQIKKREPRAAEIMSLVAVLDRHNVPKPLLRKDEEEATEFTRSLEILQAFSLIAAERGENLEIHRLVQLSIRIWLELEGTLSDWQEEALTLLSEKFPLGTYENWVICEALFPHIQVVLGYTFKGQHYLLQYATLLYKAAYYDYQRGRYKIAGSEGMRAFEIRTEVLGKEHPDTLMSMSNLAMICLNQGKWEQAEVLEEQVLQTRKRVLGGEHPDTITSMNSLAATYRKRGRWEQAGVLQVRALDICKRVLGEEHPDTIASMSNLASTYLNQGRWDQAEVLQVQALDIRKSVLGEEHPDTIASMSNLASTYLNQGRWKQAEVLQ
ncbi:MAG: hypothetical protein M1813_002204, partial [Trichoglossum hirsutum]